MFRLGKTVALVAVLAVVPATALAASAPDKVAGTWRKLLPAPLAIQGGTSVWTGTQLLVFGRRNITALDARGNSYIVKSVDAAEAYDSAANTWTRLSPPPGPGYVPAYKAVWTGKEMLAFGAFHSVALNPRTSEWRELRSALPEGIVVWTGRDAIGWGGGCCGDAQSNGAAYNPATDTYRDLPRSPLAPSQGPKGAWTGRELLLFVSGYSPDGKLYPASLARAAAYNPATSTWRRIAPLPVSGMRFSGTAAWDGHELLVVGAGENARATFAYDPATNDWRRLASLPSGRSGAQTVWTGKRLLLWGGLTRRDPARQVDTGNGFSYDPRTNRWSTIPRWPLQARGASAIAWTGRALIVAGGAKGVCKPDGVHGCHTKYFADAAAFTPTTR